MATLFLSYKLEDRPIASALQKELEGLGHTIRIDTDSMVVGSAWRDDLMRALMESDAVVPIITERSIQSPFVVSEIGAARAFGQTERKMALFPLIIGDMAIPGFIQDLYVIRMQPGHSMKLPASDIDKAVEAHRAKMLGQRPRSPKLFISHRHKDVGIVGALVDVLRSAFIVGKDDIRCTSVRPYRLPVGERTADRLRAELKEAEAVIGVLTPDTRESSYVLFELGGAWAQSILTCPLLARGASVSDIPDPIQDINPLSLEDERDCQQFLDDLEDATTLERQSKVASDVADRIRNLVALSGAT
jgi:hypothetical protein